MDALNTEQDHENSYSHMDMAIMAIMKTMAAGKFKDVCLQTLDEVAATRRAVIITKRGQPVAKLVPITAPTRTRSDGGGVGVGVEPPVCVTVAAAGSEKVSSKLTVSKRSFLGDSQWYTSRSVAVTVAASALISSSV